MSILLLLVAWWFLAPRDDDVLSDIEERGVLRVGLDASFPPLESVNEAGEIVGLDVDIARAIASDLGVEAELVNVGYDGLYDALLARRVDMIISSLPYDPRRTQDVAYTHHYFNAGQALVTRAGDRAIEKKEDLAGRIVVVEWGSQGDMEGRQLARILARSGPEAGEVTPVRQETAAGALQTLLEGEVDAAIVDGPSAVSALPRGLRLVVYLTDEWYVAAVHIESRKLLAEVNQSLARLEESGELARLQAYWFHGP
jgi:polar amino acid transport system substrate-binding protein